MKLIITVESIKGTCPAYKVGDRIVLDRGYRFNIKETTACCMHSLGAILPFYCALAKGIEPGSIGLAGRNRGDERRGYVQCPDACEETGGGTAVFSIERVEEDQG